MSTALQCQRCLFAILIPRLQIKGSSANEEAENQQMQDMLHQRDVLLTREIERTRRAERAFHQDEMAAMRERIRSLEISKREPSDVIFYNKLGFWRSRWKCIKCAHKTERSGRYKCSHCRTVQWNVR